MGKNNEIDNVVRVNFRERKPTLDQKLNDNKYQLFSDWIQHGTVLILFDARKPDVKVPVEFSKEGDLRLNFSYDFQIADFNFNQVGVWATLAFDSGEHFCMIPWTSIYGMQSAKLNQGIVWFESFPSDYDQEEVLGFSEIKTQKKHENQENVVKFITAEE
jgi:hypothetical protein